MYRYMHIHIDIYVESLEQMYAPIKREHARCIYLRQGLTAIPANAYVLMAACRMCWSTKVGYVSITHLEAESSLNEKGD